jgi:hypothetical protein
LATFLPILSALLSTLHATFPIYAVGWLSPMLFQSRVLHLLRRIAPTYLTQGLVHTLIVSRGYSFGQVYPMSLAYLCSFSQVCGEACLYNTRAHEHYGTSYSFLESLGRGGTYTRPCLGEYTDTNQPSGSRVTGWSEPSLVSTRLTRSITSCSAQATSVHGTM